MPAKKTTKKSSEASAPKAPAAKKHATKATSKAAKKPVKTSAAGTTPEESAVSASLPAAVKATPDMIARAAYLNYRRRVEQGHPGDRESDWLEAERQLQG